MDDGRRLVHSSKPRVQHAQKELMIFAGAQRALELPQINAETTDAVDDAPMDRHVCTDRDDLIAPAQHHFDSSVAVVRNCEDAVQVR
jgi:hypothetical protein